MNNEFEKTEYNFEEIKKDIDWWKKFLPKNEGERELIEMFLEDLEMLDYELVND